VASTASASASGQPTGISTTDESESPLGRTHLTRSDHRNAGCQRLCHRQAKGLALARQNEHVAALQLPPVSHRQPNDPTYVVLVCKERHVVRPMALAADNPQANIDSSLLQEMRQGDDPLDAVTDGDPSDDDSRRWLQETVLDLP